MSRRDELLATMEQAWREEIARGPRNYVYGGCWNPKQVMEMCADVGLFEHELLLDLRDASRSLLKRLNIKNSPNGEYVTEAMNEVQSVLDGIACSL